MVTSPQEALTAGFDPQAPGQPAVDVDPSEVRIRLVDHQITVRIQRRGEAAQGRGSAHPGLTGQQTHAGRHVLVFLVKVVRNQQDCGQVPTSVLC